MSGALRGLRAAQAGIGARVTAAVAALPAPIRGPLANPWINGLIAVLIAFALVSFWGGGTYDSYVTLLLAVYVIAALGLNIPAGFGGALSLGQGAAFAVGAYVAGILTSELGWVIWWTLPAALAAGFVVGLGIGAPAGRLGTIGLAMVSLGLTLVTTDLILELDSLTGGTAGVSGIVPIVVPGGEQTDSELLLPAIILACAYLAYVAHHRIRHSRFGRASLAVRDGEPGAIALGVSPYRTRVLGFALGSAFGSLAGGLFAYLSLYLTPNALNSQLSIMLLVMVILGGAGSVYGPLLGALVLTLVPLELTAFPGLNAYLYGALLIALMLLRPRGLLSGTSAAVPNPFAGRAAGTGEPDAGKPEPDGQAPVLVARGVAKSFGGVRALDGVDLEVRPGQVLGLVGPNGSGKTTLLNVLSGLYAPTAGTITLDGENLVGRRPHEIARHGVGRTFQIPKTFPGLGVGEHFALHRRAGVPAGTGAAMAAELLRAGGIDPGDAAAMRGEGGRLSHGQLRFLEIAVAVHAGPRVLLLDEPAAGLASAEIDKLAECIRALAAAGCAVIVVEHHLDFIRRLVDEVIVLDLGTVLWKGPPGELATADAVRTAYLGEK
ncbi:branched-chain amino acid ABC transporter permease [Actinomadura sp. NBRC 104412]|uniref:branched-chain amino acid ABC transporter ATP-binding protein/permease n=1 Tax=Actinomadura sp. NBRC 104412 TaxID=3032203 RepID=UPI0024A2A32A|nr:ATP-binding cassette domain-containing protein [Actinomadura sp. NBRC 104412]GLZ06186.1 branched-chain amino acid ABC transporter permease [Actinomadura sp. NBRC 104412]